MRIAILADPIDNQKAGIHYYTRELLLHLGLIDSEIEYISISQQHHPEIQNIRQISVKPYGYIPGYKAYRMFVKIPLLLRKLGVDAVVEPAHFGPFNLPKKIKRVTVIHDLTPILFPEYHVYHSQLLQKIFLKSILRRAGMILTNSNYTRDDILKVYPFTAGRVHPIYLGKDAQFVPQSETEAVLQKYGIVQPYFLFVGTIEPRKNLEVLLQAFAQLKENYHHDNLSLVIVGQKGWKYKAVFDRIAQHPFKKDIKLPGYVERKEQPAFYSGAIACIQPSKYEGFGLPVVEAMSCGTPCIVSDISSLPEIGGEGVLRFDPENASELEQQMQQLLTKEELHKDLAAKALKRGAAFDWFSHAREFDRLMKQLIARS